jgi:sugar lactone lactonase YvrE
LTRSAPFNNGNNLHYALGAIDGTKMDSDGSYCAMSVGSFQVYNRALTAGDVLMNYNSNKSIYGL